jgi:hypothetical protein
MCGGLTVKCACELRTGLRFRPSLKGHARRGDVVPFASLTQAQAAARSLVCNRYGGPTSFVASNRARLAFDLLIGGALIPCINPGMMPTLISASR